MGGGEEEEQGVGRGRAGVQHGTYSVVLPVLYDPAQYSNPCDYSLKMRRSGTLQSYYDEVFIPG